MIQCFVLHEDLEETIRAIERSVSPWIVVLSWRATWAQKDWYPRLLDLATGAAFDVIVPTTNSPAPKWQRVRALDSHDMVVQRKHASKLTGGPVDVTLEAEKAAPVAALMMRENAKDFLGGGLGEVHARAAQWGRVGCARSVYAIQT